MDSWTLVSTNFTKLLTFHFIATRDFSEKDWWYNMWNYKVFKNRIFKNTEWLIGKLILHGKRLIVQLIKKSRILPSPDNGTTKFPAAMIPIKKRGGKEFINGRGWIAIRGVASPLNPPTESKRNEINFAVSKWGLARLRATLDREREGGGIVGTGHGYWMPPWAGEFSRVVVIKPRDES